MSIRLYEYFRSSASYRVRIALHLKGIAYEPTFIHLTRGGGMQHGPDYAAVNPLALVPVFVQGKFSVSQSMAILEYLEETHPETPLLPRAPADRAHVRELAMAVACDIHPLNNLRVLKYLRENAAMDEERVRTWARHWIRTGFDGIEAILRRSPQRGRFCFGDAPTMADCCLVPQVFNARRFDLSLEAYPLLQAIEAECQALPAFQLSHPARQADAE